MTFRMYFRRENSNIRRNSRQQSKKSRGDVKYPESPGCFCLYVNERHPVTAFFDNAAAGVRSAVKVDGVLKLFILASKGWPGLHVTRRGMYMYVMPTPA